MTSLLRLPVRAAVLATAPTRFAVKTLLRLVRDESEPAPSQPQASPAPAAPPTPPRPRKAPARRPSPKAARRAARHEPTRGQAAALREQAREEEQAAGGPGPGPEIHVAEPWKGYDAMTEDEILERLTGADPTLRAAARLYESTHGGRRQVLIATEEPVAQP